MRAVPRIDLDEARLLIEGALRRAGEIGVPMCIAVADDNGSLVAFERQDGAKVTSVSIAIDKAFTAAGARNDTAFYAAGSVPGGPAWGIDHTNSGHFTVIRGGVPVVAGGQVVGGVGISGGTSREDHDVAVEAVRLLAERRPEFATRDKVQNEPFRVPGAPGREAAGPLSATLYAADQPKSVILLHSLALDRRIWWPLIDVLSTRLAVLACDLPGHGKSPRAPEPTIEAMADMVAATAAAAGISSAAVVGMSLGGSVAQAVAVRHPRLVRALALLDTTAWYGLDAIDNWSKRAAQARGQGMPSLSEFQLERWFSDQFRLQRPDVCASILRVFAACALEGYTDACTALGTLDMREAVSSVSCPTAIVVGELDGATPVSASNDIHARIPNSTLHVIEGCKHLSAVERPGPVLSHIAMTIGA